MSEWNQKKIPTCTLLTLYFTKGVGYAKLGVEGMVAIWRYLFFLSIQKYCCFVFETSVHVM